jgi:serine/threonine-protein kinase ATR
VLQAVFRVLDYANRWLHARRSRAGPDAALPGVDDEETSRLQKALDQIPAHMISERAIDCKDYSRALFYLEQYARSPDYKNLSTPEQEPVLDQLCDIYAAIDEPDGIEGISSLVGMFNMNVQVLADRKAGRGEAAQVWFEIEVANKADNHDLVVELMHCLKQRGQDGKTSNAHSPALVTSPY